MRIKLFVGKKDMQVHSHEDNHTIFKEKATECICM